MTPSGRALTRREVIAGLAAAGMVSGCLSEEDSDVPTRRTSKSYGGMTIYNDTMLPPLEARSPPIPITRRGFRCTA